MKPPEILFEDKTCFVLNKPSGLAVQGGKAVGESVDALLKRACPGEQPLLVHRLDKDTSGALLVAKGAKNAAWYARRIAERKTLKQYVAVCAASGRPNAESGRLDTAVDVHGKEKEACTRYRRVKEGETGGFSFVVLELELETGRFHQIRQQLRMAGYPILGDDKHGDFAVNKRLKKTRGLRRLLLHACRLSVPHPDGGLIRVHAPPPPEFEGWL